MLSPFQYFISMIIFVWRYFSPAVDPNITEDSNLTTIELIRKYGYTSEFYCVTTEDGYILELHRISGSQKSPPRKGKKVCFLQHGVMDSSAGWILSGPDHALGYRLADEGWDVWLGNTRGNVYSTNHTEYSPFSIFPHKRRQFWSFTWHELGYYDLPAMIDFVLKKTEQTKLQYIGHSQGSTAFLVMLSERPEYNEKIEMMHAIAPVCFLTHVKSPPILFLSVTKTIFEKLTAFIGLNFVPPTPITSKFALRRYSPIQMAFKHSLYVAMGYNTDQLNTSLLPVIQGHVPAGCSLNSISHYGQLIATGRFQKFKPGISKDNTDMDYNLKNVKIPVALYYSDKDWVATCKDIQKLKGILPNLVKDHFVTAKKFNHMDLLWGRDAPTVVFDEIVTTMKSFETQNS